MPPFDINTTTATTATDIDTITTTGINITPVSGINFYYNTGVAGEPATYYSTININNNYPSISINPDTLYWIFLKETGKIVGINGCVDGQDIYIYFTPTAPAEDEIKYEPMLLSTLDTAMQLYRAQVQEFISAEDESNDE